MKKEKRGEEQMLDFASATIHRLYEPSLISTRTKSCH